jgi:hypothetical protein
VLATCDEDGDETLPLVVWKGEREREKKGKSERERETHTDTSFTSVFKRLFPYEGLKKMRCCFASAVSLTFAFLGRMTLQS